MEHKTSRKKTLDEILQDDLRDLHRLGYAQQLYREMGGFSNFAISFSIISILTGSIQLFGYGLQFAGPMINTLGWPLVSVLVLCVAASMAELASAYPTAGGLYFWAFRLGGVGWAWATAWFNMIGQVCITAGINFAAAQYVVGTASRIWGAESPGGSGLVLGVVVLLLLPQVLINAFGIRLTALLNDFSVYWHIGGVLLILMLFSFLGSPAEPLSSLFQPQVTISPVELSRQFSIGPWVFDSILLRVGFLRDLYNSGGFALPFVLALLQAQWTYTGFDASAHVAEETIRARVTTAWGVFLSVAVSAVVGYLMLLVLTAHVHDLPATVKPENAPAVLYLAYRELPRAAAHVVAIVIGGAMWLCGLSSITSMSRMWFAFARDGGMPGYTLLRRVHPHWRTPIWAICVTALLSVLLTVYAGLFSVVVALSTSALYLAYGIPIGLNLRNRLRGRGEFASQDTAPWNLGRWSPALNMVSVVWVGFITVLFALPPNELAGWSLLGLGLFMAAYWLLDARRRFKGPVPTLAAEQRRQEAAVES